MNRTAATVVLVVVMIAVIVAVDVLFLRDRLWLRLGTNVGIVVLALGIYAGFIRR